MIKAFEAGQKESWNAAIDAAEAKFKEMVGKKKEIITTLEEKLKEKIEVANSDIKVCMRDFKVNEEPNSNYVTNRSKSEIYHRGRLLGLENIQTIINNLKG